MKVWQQPLPEIYQQLSDAELRLRIESARQALGDRLVILGHHYQQDAVVEFADFTGDSFELSRNAASRRASNTLFSAACISWPNRADILTDESVRVILPDLGAGCSMADMANLDQTLECWEQLKEQCPDQTIVPITYMNSSAAIKAFVGEHGGAVCTSSNCRNVLEWAHGRRGREQWPVAGGQWPGTDRRGQWPVAGGQWPESSRFDGLTAASSGPASAPRRVKVLFFPDQHLGRNTAYAMGYPLDRMVVWDPRQDLGGNDPRRLHDADFVLWKGHCSVHPCSARSMSTRSASNTPA